MTHKVFISSTSVDLADYRRAALEECIRLGMLPIAMEFFEAMAQGATEGSRRKLDDADLYLGFFAHRYGYIETGFQASVTECEFDYAGECRLDRLCFLVDPGHPIDVGGGEVDQRARLDDFRRKVERSVIRAQFTTVDDFRGKVRLALQEWQAGNAKARLPQPLLASNVLPADAASRLTYRARVTPFVGRDRERAALDRFLAAPTPLAWTVVSGPGGAGKSRLVQEFCLALGGTPPRAFRSDQAESSSNALPWRAGFLVPKQTFDWATWQPNADTLIAIDYAGERVDEIRAMLGALVTRGDLGARVRVLLVERAATGAWMEALAGGGRSDGYAIEQARSAESPLVLGGLAPEELWAAVQGVLQNGSRALPAKDAVLARLREIDPEGRPLFATFAADALAAGRDLSDWDRERLLRDVLGRERRNWSAAGVPASYEHLLALATAVGGDTEAILDAAGAALRLPTFRDFDRALYDAMTGCGADGDAVPALKPDLLGEFFVLEHVKGRNERITALNAAELVAAAWRVRGGAKAENPFGVAGITYVSPSRLILFLTRVGEDFPDHPATRQLLRRPQIEGADLRYWATLVALGIRGHAMRGDGAAAKCLFDELGTMTPEALAALDGVGGFVRAGLYLLPVLVKEGKEGEAREVLTRVRAVLDARGWGRGETLDFCEAAQETVVLLLSQGSRAFVEELIETQAQRVRAGAENQELRLPYARSLAATVRVRGELAERERAFGQLRDFCKSLQDDVSLYEPLAAAALALCIEYAGDPSRLADAEKRNNLIRELARRRSEQRVYRFKEPFSLDHEWVVDDLRQMRLYLTAANTELVGPWTLAERFREASLLVDEAMSLCRLHRDDVEFARGWAVVVVRHADARAQQGAVEQVLKAIEALRDAASHFDGDPSFAHLAAELCRAATVRAASRGDTSAAEETLRPLRELAERESAPPQVVASYAEAAFEVYFAYDNKQKAESAAATAKRSAWAIRSEAYLARLRARGTDPARLDEIVRWAESLEADEPPPGNESARERLAAMDRCRAGIAHARNGLARCPQEVPLDPADRVARSFQETLRAPRLATSAPPGRGDSARASAA